MKTWLILILGLLFLSSARVHAQFMVYRDEKGQVLTTVDNYATGLQYATTASHTKATFLESPFLTFPVWQEGTIQLDRSGKKLRCQLAYNLVSNEVLCRFAGDSAVKIVTPEFFSINNTEFTRLQNHLAGIEYRTYFSLLHDGPTRLWMSLSSRLEPLNSADEIRSRFHRDLSIRSIYRVSPKYYIQKGDSELSPVSLAKKSLLEVFSDYPAAIDAKIPDKSLTANDLLDAVNYYDFSAAEARKDLRNLPKDEAFKAMFRNRITYPAGAGYQGIYGRVYAGFDVDSLGKVRNVVILSPDNVGFGFIEAVKKMLERLSDVNPTFRGHYALPIAFTYTNSNDKTGTHWPLNRLADNYLDGCTLLAELVVPIAVAKSTISSQEVWGYYK